MVIGRKSIFFTSAKLFFPVLYNSEGLEKMNGIEEGTVVRLAELAENSKAEVTVISTESEDGVSLQKAFGGLAAILRYPIS